MSRVTWNASAVALLLVAVAVTGCRAEQRHDDADLLVELVAVGGMCPSGDECRSVTTVDRAGSWTLSAEDGTSRTGTLPAELLAGLTAEVDGTTPGSLTATPFTGRCERDADGTEWILTLLPGSGDEQRVSSCEHVIPEVPLVDVLAAVAEETRA